MTSRNLLVIADAFPDRDENYLGGIFIKEQLKCLRRHFDRVFVIAATPLGIGRLRHVRFSDYHYDNVQVFFPVYVNFPLIYFIGRNLWVWLERTAISKLIKRERLEFDIVHAHYTWPAGRVAVDICKEYKKPLVITEHSSLTFRHAIQRRDQLFVHTWEMADAIIRVREGDTNLFDEVGIPREKVYSIPNGFDNEFFKPMDRLKCRRILHIPEQTKMMLTVGFLSKVKGHEYLIRAVSLLRQLNQKVTCFVIGGGSSERRLSRIIVQERLANQVVLLGQKPHKEIPIWINACDVFVLPSLAEGNPTVMFEVLGCGKPFIGSRVGGIPEVIDNSEIGLLCEPRNPKDLAEKIIQALDTEWNPEKILARAAEYTWESVASRIRAVYQEVLANHDPTCHRSSCKP